MSLRHIRTCRWIYTLMRSRVNKSYETALHEPSSAAVSGGSRRQTDRKENVTVVCELVSRFVTEFDDRWKGCCEDHAPSCLPAFFRARRLHWFLVFKYCLKTILTFYSKTLIMAVGRAESASSAWSESSHFVFRSSSRPWWPGTIWILPFHGSVYSSIEIKYSSLFLYYLWALSHILPWRLTYQINNKPNFLPPEDATPQSKAIFYFYMRCLET